VTLRPDLQPYIVAEIGPSWCTSADHSKNLETLRTMIEVAARVGCDAVKLQLKSFGHSGYYRDEKMDAVIEDPASPFRSRWEFVNAREPTQPVLAEVDRWAKQFGIHWTASPWDVPALQRLLKWNPPWVKIASASLTDDALLTMARTSGVPVVLSCGMSTLDELDHAVSLLDRKNLILAHCTSAYPTRDEDANLATIAMLRERYGVPVGYSCHVDGIEPPKRAVAKWGACWIEKHFTLSRSAWGPDHKVSLEPHGLELMVRDIRRGPVLDGCAEKRVLPAEEQFRKRLRRG
jgi:N-acetylneuraminate synthase